MEDSKKIYEKLYKDCLRLNDLSIVDEFIKKLTKEDLKMFCKENSIKFGSKNEIIKEIKKWYKIKYVISKNIY